MRERRHPKSLARRIAVVAGSVLVALVLVFTVLLALIDSGAVAAQVKDAVLPKLSERLGREVTLETAQARLFPHPQVTLGHLVIHGLPGEPPLVETARADVELRVWPLIRSFGKDVEIDAVSVVQPELNLVRKEDGTWNYEGLGSSAPSSEREVSIERIDVTGGQVRVIDRSASGGEATVALHQIDLKLENVGFGEALSLSGAAAFASDGQNLHVDLSTSSLRAGELPKLHGTLKLQNAELPRLSGLLPAKLAELTTGGRLGLDLKVASADGAYQVEGDATADALQLRGAPAKGRFHLKTAIDPNALAATQIELTRLFVKGPGVELAGSAHAALSPREVQFALQGPLLDLDQLLGVLPEKEETARRTALLPAKVRAQLEGTEVRGTLKVDRVINGKLALEHLDAQAVLESGVLTLSKAQADLYGGRVDASGTTANLTQAVPTWNLRARLQRVDLDQAMAQVAGAAPLEGRIDAALDVKGEGADWAAIREDLTGTGAVALRDGALTTTDLGEKLGGAVAQALRSFGKPGAAGTVQKATGRTELKDLAASFRIHDGWMELKEPLVFTSGFGGARLDGRIGLDQRLALKGDVVLSRDFLTSIVGSSRFLPQGPITVPLKIGGTLKSPAVTGIDAGALAKSLAQGAASSQAAQQVEDQVKRQAREKAGDFLRRLGGGR